MENLCIASTNKGKIRELKSILNNSFKLCSLDDFNALPEPEEPFESFLENARAKAIHYAKLTHMLTLSEDAGLCIHSLNNFPGIHSKRFIVKSGSLQNAFDQLEKMLPIKENRRAEFVCVSVIYNPQNEQSFAGKGTMRGEIQFPPKGSHGFGFDPIFKPEGYNQTIAELGESVKAAIGHRGKSIGALLENYHSKLSP
ncbi:MAG: non-canonical purine NTP pyrophosphatase [Puniceicoccales bacterium]|jgi:XTP/dITP diphosphohydrolase|nr:non-canonical purine NTP pyrophosphatase [Puniceicoccales bacterium]